MPSEREGMVVSPQGGAGPVRTTVVTLGVIAALFLTFYSLSYAALSLLGIPHGLDVSLGVRLIGYVALIASLAIAVWLFAIGGRST